MRKIVIFIIILLSGCTASSPEAINKEIYKRYNVINAYTANVTVTVNSNLTSNKYEMTHHYKAPDNYRIDVESPLSGLSYILTDGTLKMISGSQEAQFEDYIMKDSNNMFLTAFFNKYYSSDNTEQVSKDIQIKETVLELDIDNGFSQKLWIDNKSYNPIRLETYDADKKAVITVEFNSFKLNEVLEFD